MSSEGSGEGTRGSDSDRGTRIRETDPHLFHGDEEYDESEAAEAEAAERRRGPLREGPPPSGEDLVEEGGHIPSQEEWVGTTSSGEESLEEAAEEEAGGEVARRREALRRDGE